MSRLQKLLWGIVVLSTLASAMLPMSVAKNEGAAGIYFSLAGSLLILCNLLACFYIWEAKKSKVFWRCFAATVGSLLAAVFLFMDLGDLAVGHQIGSGFFAALLSAWILAWLAVEFLTDCEPAVGLQKMLWSLAIPLFFGLWLLLLWELSVRALQVPAVLLPAPSDIAIRFASSLDILWVDFVQTFVKSVLSGYVMGCGAGFVVAVLIDRSPFLQRGLLPLGNLASALPIVGVAPIMVMWFGFDWQSKAAVVVVMTFFPMLVNTVEGLAASSNMQRDLMHSYGASYWQSLFKLRLPAAMPLIFNALKINSTLALIGAIVAEFFGTPIVGMGFRISTEVGRMNLDMVWAEITVAAIAGSLFYWIVSQFERWVAHWHPSIRRS